MPAPADFGTWPRDKQIEYLYSTYGNPEDRARENGISGAFAGPKFRSHNVNTQPWVSEEERQLWAQVNRDSGTWAGNALREAAPAALGLGLAAALGPAVFGGSGAAGSNLGYFANGGTGGLAGLGGGNAGALAASGAITGGAGIGGTIGGALGQYSGLANQVSGVGGGMGWDWGNILEYGVPIIGGLLERDGAKDAASASAAGSAAALAENRRQYDQTRADMLPWMQAGQGALGRLQDPNAFQASPGYNFVRNEGQRGIENSFAARGGAASGNALRALSEFNTGLASQEHGNWWNQQAGLAGVGQAATNSLGAFGANAANNAGGLMQNQANARASGIEGSTNAWSNTLQNLLSTWGRRQQNTMGL
jgi:hypothetical protein